MKQLIENQMKEFRENFLSENNAGQICWSILGRRTELIIDWHKQSLKQFIDELLVKLEEKIKVIEKRQRDFTNDPLHPFNAHLLGTKDALKGQISHLKKLKEELN